VREYLSSEFEMPPCPEQSCVAAILDTLDETIRRSRDLIAKLKLIKQGLLRDLLTRGIDHTGRLRPAPATAPHAYQHSTAGLIPAEWETSTFGEQVEFRGGFGFSDRFQGLAQGDLPFFKVSDMSKAGNEKLLQKANNYVSRTTASRQGWSPAPPGGVAFAKVGAALLLNRRRILSSDSLVDNNMMVAVAGPSLDPTWLYWWLQTVDFGAFVQPGALPSVNQGQLGSLQIAYPDLREQRTIATVLDTSDSRIASERQGFDKLRALKSGLLEDLLSGRVSVSVPDEGLV
jgi:type I restriction enzyme S subunit